MENFHANVKLGIYRDLFPALTFRCEWAGYFALFAGAIGPQQSGQPNFRAVPLQDRTTRLRTLGTAGTSVLGRGLAYEPPRAPRVRRPITKARTWATAANSSIGISWPILQEACSARASGT